MERSISSCREFITRDVVGEPDGNLSLEYGFLPQALPEASLPKPYHIWDKAVNEVPTLFYSNVTPGYIEAIKQLTTDKLEDRFLPRASLVLSILASAYWRHGIKNYFLVRNNIDNGTLPDRILKPWIEVTERLKRGSAPFQSGADLFLNNFRLRSGAYTPDEVKIENLDVLVPSFNNEAERVFYMSFVDIHARMSPVVAEICKLEEAILSYTDETKSEVFTKVSQCLAVISKAIKAATGSLLKISPVEVSKTYCDPVVWAKTVGVFAIPPSNFVQGGTSGTSVPMLHALDALVGRRKYSSHYGEYVSQHGVRLLDIKTKGFVYRIARMDLRGWLVAHMDDSEPSRQLITTFNELMELYAGLGGFLDKHLSKVFNYLGVATLVGRNQSTSGHERYINRETWKQVCEDLKIAQYEREKLHDEFVHRAPVAVPDKSGPATIKESDVARHYTLNDGWLIISGKVFDVSGYAGRHPGGKDILSAYLGRDATREFGSINAHAKEHIYRQLDKLQIGVLASNEQNEKFRTYKDLIYALQRSYSILNMQTDRDEGINIVTLFHLQAHNSFINEQLDIVFNLLGEPNCIRPVNVNAIIDSLYHRNLIYKRMESLYRLSKSFLYADTMLIKQLLEVLLDETTDIPNTRITVRDMVKKWCVKMEIADE